MNNGQNQAIGGGGFHHVAFSVTDFDKSMAFYQGALGFVPRYAWGEDARGTGCADSRAVLLDTGDGNYIEVFGGGQPATPGGEGAGRIMHIALRSSDAAAAYGRAMAAGAQCHAEPRTVPVAGTKPMDFTIAFVKGPDGEIIEFFQNDEL